MVSFVERLRIGQQQTGGEFGVLIAPVVEKLPLPIQRYDEPFFPFGKAIINATRDLVCAYVFDLASYLVLGAAGVVALERTIKYAGGDRVTILHGPFSGARFAHLSDETSFGVDALTLVDGQYLDAYLEREDRCAFVVRSDYAQVADEPAKGGVFWADDDLFVTIREAGKPLYIRLVGQQVLYAGRGEDFADQVRVKLERLRR